MKRAGRRKQTAEKTTKGARRGVVTRIAAQLEELNRETCGRGHLVLNVDVNTARRYMLGELQPSGGALGRLKIARAVVAAGGDLNRYLEDGKIVLTTAARWAAEDAARAAAAEDDLEDDAEDDAEDEDDGGGDSPPAPWAPMPAGARRGEVVGESPTSSAAQVATVATSPRIGQDGKEYPPIVTGPIDDRIRAREYAPAPSPAATLVVVRYFHDGRVETVPAARAARLVNASEAEPEGQWSAAQAKAVLAAHDALQAQSAKAIAQERAPGGPVDHPGPMARLRAQIGDWSR